VRIGTAEIYRQVEQIDEVVEALCVGQDWQGDVRVVLFVRLREGVSLDESLRERIRRRIRENASPRHVCLAAERCWDQARWAVETYAWRFDGLERAPRT
jgi:acyl-coenzyme A synthetase/AMP-(fatty) acid ligase